MESVKQYDKRDEIFEYIEKNLDDSLIEIDDYKERKSVYLSPCRFINYIYG